MRVVIGGGPRTGKTTASFGYPQPVRHTDHLISADKDHSLDTQAALVQPWLADRDPWVIEGATAFHALRYWLRAHRHQPGGDTARPADLVIYLRAPLVRTTLEQDVMAKGIATVWRQIRPELERRGVRVQLG